jgi:hypothetical protein
MAGGGGGGGGEKESLKFAGKHAMAKCFGPESLVMTWWNRHPIYPFRVSTGHMENRRSLLKATIQPPTSPICEKS